MSFHERFSILRMAGMLSPTAEAHVNGILDYFCANHGIVLTEDNAAAFVTHLCAVFERIEKGEPVEALDEAVYEDCRQEPTFRRARAIADELGRRHPELPETELRFLTMHLGVLLQQAP